MCVFVPLRRLSYFNSPAGCIAHSSQKGNEQSHNRPHSFFSCSFVTLIQSLVPAASRDSFGEHVVPPDVRSEAPSGGRDPASRAPSWHKSPLARALGPPDLASTSHPPAPKLGTRRDRRPFGPRLARHPVLTGRRVDCKPGSVPPWIAPRKRESFI